MGLRELSQGVGHFKDVAVDDGWDRLFMFRGWVVLAVSFGLSGDVGVGLALGVEDGAVPTTLHEGLCHMIDGRSGSG